MSVPQNRISERASTDLVETTAAALAAGRPVVLFEDRICAIAIAAERVDTEKISDLMAAAGGEVSVAIAADYDGRGAVPGDPTPIRVATGGVLERPRIPEAAVALAEIAGLEPVVCVCEILDDGGGALAPEDLAGHPRYSTLPAISPLLVRGHRRGLTELAPVQTDTFREAMSLLAGGVVGVTTRDSEGRPRGMLATAVTSYTDNPPSLLISAAHASRTHDPLVEAVGIGVHLLSQDQSDVASVLAGKSDDKFAELEWEWDGDVPHIPGALAYMRCERAHTVTHYDHTIVIADVETTAIGEALPLIYFERSLGWQLVSPEA